MRSKLPIGITKICTMIYFKVTKTEEENKEVFYSIQKDIRKLYANETAEAIKQIWDKRCARNIEAELQVNITEEHKQPQNPREYKELLKTNKRRKS